MMAVARPGGVRTLGLVALLTWSALALLEPDRWTRAGMVALAVTLGVVVLLRPVGPWLARTVLAPPHTVFVAACALAAAAVTAWVAHRTLRDQPLAIDAGVYLMQARALADGHIGMAPPHPFQAFADHFLFEGPDGKLYGVFPPGWPLALVPFVWIDRPMLAGPAVAALLVVSQAALGRAVARASPACETAGELATRLSLLLPLPSIARALLTADLLSNAFVAVLAATAIALAIGVASDPGTSPRMAAARRLRGLALGACVGWTLASRLLDGLLMASAVAAVLAWTARGRRALFWSLLGAVPFVVWLFAEQHAATGEWLMPTQSLYFQRSDWPPTCHRLGFGPDVGCSVEHPGMVALMGGDGFGADDALRVVCERAAQLGEDVFGFAPLALVAFIPVVVAGSAIDAFAVAFVLALTVAYGLFYYGNVMYFGARFLFPAAPFFWLLAARGAALVPHRRAGILDARHARGAAMAVLLVTVAAGSVGPWRTRSAGASEFQSARSDLRRTMDAHSLDMGILKTRDDTSFAAAFDPWRDDGRRIFAVDDGSGLLELRRAHPELPVFLSLAGDDVGRMFPSQPAPGTLVELERGWPSFVRPSRLGARPVAQEGASGGAVLLLSHASPGSELAVPFEVAVPATYALRVKGMRGPDQGDYAVALDGVELTVWRGWAPLPQPSRTEAAARTVTGGRHVLVFRCVGRDAASEGYDARLDALVGE